MAPLRATKALAVTRRSVSIYITNVDAEYAYRRVVVWPVCSRPEACEQLQQPWSAHCQGRFFDFERIRIFVRYPSRVLLYFPAPGG